MIIASAFIAMFAGIGFSLGSLFSGKICSVRGESAFDYRLNLCTRFSPRQLSSCT